MAKRKHGKKYKFNVKKLILRILILVLIVSLSISAYFWFNKKN